MVAGDLKCDAHQPVGKVGVGMGKGVSCQRILREGLSDDRSPVNLHLLENTDRGRAHALSVSGIC